MTSGELYAYWAYQAVMLILAAFGITKLLDMIEDWRAARANRRFTARLLLKFPDRPDHSRRVFDAIVRGRQ